MRLTAVHHFDLSPGCGLANLVGQQLRLLEIGAVAVVDRDQLVAHSQGADRRDDGSGHVVIDSDQSVIGIEHDRLAFADLHTTDRRVANRRGHGQRLDGAARRGHGRRVVRGLERRVHGQQSRKALGRVPRRHDADRSVRHLGDLPRREHDVWIVGQDQDLVGSHGIDRLEELAGAGIRGLSPDHDATHAEVAEDGCQAVARRNRDDRQRRDRVRRGGAGSRERMT